ncbi:MAG TPA: radical SAM protein [Acidimicrobiales bacterium]|nr:radical SAM protein [Acidimicrobiales bacterium]
MSFLWLELTNRCNLRCVHCYTESDPWTGDRDILTVDDYEDVMTQAYALGCRQIQLIGGEPQLNPSFKRLLRQTVSVGFDFVEVFSNLTRLEEETVEFSATNGVHFATSVYSDDPAVHDGVTTVPGSHRRTIANLRRLVAHGVPTRAAVISMDGDREAAERTERFLVELGVGSVRCSGPEAFGRGEQLLGRAAAMDGLCGHCWNGNLAVGPDGTVFPCVMARQWAAGDITEQSLEEILRGDALAQVRREIHDQVWVEKLEASCTPYCHQSCQPDLSCPCDPLLCQQSCAPWDAPRIRSPQD